jgi:hypothetical protein
MRARPARATLSPRPFLSAQVQDGSTDSEFKTPQPVDILDRGLKSTQKRRNPWTLPGAEVSKSLGSWLAGSATSKRRNPWTRLFQPANR